MNEDISGNTTKDRLDIHTSNGRMVFPDIESVQTLHTRIKDFDEIKISKVVSIYQDRDFQSLIPIITDDNEIEVFSLYKKRFEELNVKINTSKSTSRNVASPNDDDYLDRVDDLEDIIGDEAFASFLNENGELQVADQIYKYTDAGLFITPEKSYNNLNTYLDNQQISRSLFAATPQYAVQKFILEEAPSAGYSQIDDQIQYFRPASSSINPTSTSPAVNPQSSTYSPPDKPTPFSDFISKLTPCNSRNGLFGIFGDSQVCIDKYESARRVKTKAFDYNYGIVFHLGVKVKHQKKGWTGIWRKEDAEEIGLYVEDALWNYNFSEILAPTLFNINFKTAFLSAKKLPTRVQGVYTFVEGVTFWGQPIYRYDYTSGYPYPFQVFYDDFVVEYWGRSNSLDEKIFDNLTKKAKKEALNKEVWKNIHKSTKSFLKGLANPASDPNASFNTYVNTENITYITKDAYFGKVYVSKRVTQNETNDSDISRTFDWGIGVKLVWKSPYNILKTTPGEPDDIQQPKNLSMKLYGAAKRNGQWHGSLLQF